MPYCREAAPRTIDDHRRVFHTLDAVAIDEVPVVVGQVHVEADDITVFQQSRVARNIRIPNGFLSI